MKRLHEYHQRKLLPLTHKTDIVLIDKDVHACFVSTAKVAL